jgi:Arc/MetJ-type ribon-helix-helix transcriptional regulator
MPEQAAIGIPAELASALDRLVRAGRFSSRADAVRVAIEELVEKERRREVGARIADGYRKIPQDDGEVAAAAESALKSIREESW